MCYLQEFAVIHRKHITQADFGAEGIPGFLAEQRSEQGTVEQHGQFGPEAELEIPEIRIEQRRKPEVNIAKQAPLFRIKCKSRVNTALPAYMKKQGIDLNESAACHRIRMAGTGLVEVIVNNFVFLIIPVKPELYAGAASLVQTDDRVLVIGTHEYGLAGKGEQQGKQEQKKPGHSGAKVHNRFFGSGYCSYPFNAYAFTKNHNAFSFVKAICFNELYLVEN